MISAVFQYKYISDRSKHYNTMRQKLWILSIAVCSIAACNTRGDSDSDDKDTINASKTEQSLLEDSLDATKADTVHRQQ